MNEGKTKLIYALLVAISLLLFAYNCETSGGDDVGTKVLSL